MERKQMEINENNVREFCNVIDCNQGENGGEGWGQGGEGACTQIANVWERADFHRREVRLNCYKSGPEVANTLGLKNATCSVQKNMRRGTCLKFKACLRHQ